MFDAVFFDLDGTLVDTESLAVTSGLAAFAACGHSVDEAFMHGLVGKAEPMAARIIRAAMPALDLTEFNAVWRESFDAAIAGGLPLKPGAAELLALISQPMALVTSSGRTGAHHKLGMAGLTAHFREVITFDDVTAAKPEPEPYLLAAQRLGVHPSRCAVFEDSDIGAEAAHRAGCVVIQIPDVAPTDGRFAAHVARDLMAGARLAGLI